MKAIWDGKSRLAKLAIVFAVLTLISVGLCAGNLALFSRYGAISGGEPVPPRSTNLSLLLIATAAVESLGMIVGAGGLVVVLVWSGGSFALKAWKGRSSRNDP